jgi:hypothetical protein
VIPPTGGTFTGTYTGFSNNVDPTSFGCTNYDEIGPDIAYTAMLAQGKTLKATLTPDPTYNLDVALYLVTDCAHPLKTCLVGSDKYVDGFPEHLSYTATTNQTVYLIADTSAMNGMGPYTLTVTIQ